MRKNKTLLLLVIGVLIFVVFAVIVITAFNSVSNNPIDKIAIPYIRQNPDLQNKYGELIWIGRNILYETKTEGSTIKCAYTIEINSGRVIVYVTLIENEGKWEAITLEEIEVIQDEN